jgi:anti-sigma B factor antagonist
MVGSPQSRGEPEMFSQSADTWLRIEEEGDVTVAKFVTQAIMDERVIRIIGQALYREVEQLGHDQLVLDFSDVRHFSSALLAVLIELNKRIKVTKGRLVLCGLRPELQEVFVVTKLNGTLKIVADMGEATRLFPGL